MRETDSSVPGDHGVDLEPGAFPSVLVILRKVLVTKRDITPA